MKSPYLLQNGQPSQLEQLPVHLFFLRLRGRTKAAAATAAITAIITISQMFMEPPQSMARPMSLTIRANTQARAHCHRTTRKACSLPSSLLMAAVAATHGV